jgi:hypothetical protein
MSDAAMTDRRGRKYLTAGLLALFALALFLFTLFNGLQ